MCLHTPAHKSDSAAQVDIEPAPKQFDQVAFIIAFEAGELDDGAVADGFQHLIDSGLVWQLQGFYGRTAMRLINAGVCHA